MGTATQVIDAQNAPNGLKLKMAVNAYKYILSFTPYYKAKWFD